MQRVASVLAHILASTAIVACGGATADVPGDPAGTSPATTSGSSPGKPPPPQPPPSTDAGTTTDAATDGGACAPVFVGTGSCSDVWHQVCGIPKDIDLTNPTQEQCDRLCGPSPAPNKYWGCSEYKLADLPGPSVECYTCVEGRRPEGYVDPPLVPTIAGWLAHAADLERVSIDAFRILQRELVHHGAPADLVARAAEAEADEVRHARVLATLARREGATLSAAPVQHGGVRALVDIALENAIEGCVRETYGALVAGWQADHARRIDVRRVMKSVYRDETAHAALAWDVHAWILERLSAEERARVERAMRDALDELAIAASLPTAPDLVSALGLPPAKEAGRLAAGLAAHMNVLSAAA
ncbi:MAG: hypothetical protein KF819_29105 [Labilithrix sp.]|nr:hypothetical protein [Labilithrix sp.]